MKQLLIFVALMVVSLSGIAKESTPKRLKLVTHESTPLMDPNLPGGGALVDSLRMVFRKMGYEIDVVYAPSWVRAKLIAKNDKTIDGYFPYATIENPETFDFSTYFIEDPWVIVERKDHPIQWKKPEDLAKYTGGNVVGVELRPGVKEAAEAGKLKIENTSNNFYNLQKLINKRVDYVFIDLYIFHSEMESNPSLKPFKDRLQPNAKPVVVSRYGVAFRKTNVPKHLVSEFNKNSIEIPKFIIGYGDRVKKTLDVK